MKNKNRELIADSYTFEGILEEVLPYLKSKKTDNETEKLHLNNLIYRIEMKIR